MPSLNILQYNIRGIVSKDSIIQIPKLSNTMMSKQIDIVLLQEWSATVREETLVFNNDSNNTQANVTQFPSKFFPEYHAHFSFDRMCILYHKDFCVTPIDPQTQQH